MPEPNVLGLFCLASLALLVVPGLSVLYIVTPLAASSLAGKLRTSRHFHRFQRYFAGGTLVALGVTAALSGSRPSNS